MKSPNISHSKTTEEKYAFYILQSRCIGLQKIDELYTECETFENIWDVHPEILDKHIGRDKTLKFLNFKQENPSHSEYLALSNKSIQIINPRSKEWVKFFVHITDKPLCLFAKGDVSLLKSTGTLSVAIIGTRKPSSYGISQTKRFSSHLANHNITILSGMALGVDSIAHRTALENGGKTIAILGSAIDKPYPSQHRELYNEILKKGGLILSEFPPGASTRPVNFIQRNRLISGLSNGVLIVEGAKRSGTLITAKYAGEQSIPTFAVPGNVSSPLSYAPNHLIQTGIKPVTSPQDILDEFNIRVDNAQHTFETLNNLSKAQKNILSHIFEPSTANEIAKKTQKPFSAILPILTELEIKGLVKHALDGTYYATIEV